MNSKQTLGQRGEQLAAEYLQQQGFAICHTNWRAHPKEVDIIAIKNGVLHVVEVRTRSTGYFMQPYESVNARKQRLLCEAANAYIEKHQLDMEVQFDIVSIVLGPGGPILEYIPNAFYAV